MMTLARWRRFLETPITIVMPRLELIGQDYEPPILVGSGEITMATAASFSFVLDGKPLNIDYAHQELLRQSEEPYNPIARPRLVGTDADGIEWAGGYTNPIIDMSRNVWRARGEIDSLNTADCAETVSREAGAELAFPMRVGDPMTLAVTGLPTLDPPGAGSRKGHQFEILGSKVHLVYEQEAGAFSLSAAHSPDLPAYSAENWLSEPLRILFGQLIFPRLVARNFGDGRAAIRIGRCPALIRGARRAGLLAGTELAMENSQIWLLYVRLLKMIACARDADGAPNFESHKITRLYEEVIQANLGSRWVWALTFASSIEALARMLLPRETKPSESDKKAIKALSSHIEQGPGPDDLKAAAMRGLRQSFGTTTKRALVELESGGVITQAQLSAWETIRNAVMHGSLVSPYSNAEADSRLLALSAMMHALTGELIRRSAN